jgi:membrane peptidoglycan carboxypeptidase
MRRALTVSSDVYFYRLGELFWNSQNRFGAVPIQEAARAFGFGVPTGVQLTDEGSGYIDEPQRRIERHQQNPTAFPTADWFTGDNVNLAIGQGELLVTPLQLANAYAALANGGTLHSPSVARAVIDHVSGQVERRFDPRVRARVELPPDQRQAILDGLSRVVSDGEGTASDGFGGFPLDTFGVAGKTGTAEVDPGKKADTALFAAFGPTADPRYAVVAVLEEAGFGADAAVPLVRRVFDYLRDPAGSAAEAARVAAAAAALQAPPLPASAPATAATPTTAPEAEEEEVATTEEDTAPGDGEETGDDGAAPPPDTTPSTAPAATTSSQPGPAPSAPPPDSTPPASGGDSGAAPATTTLSPAGPDPPGPGAGGGGSGSGGGGP